MHVKVLLAQLTHGSLSTLDSPADCSKAQQFSRCYSSPPRTKKDVRSFLVPAFVFCRKNWLQKPHRSWAWSFFAQLVFVKNIQELFSICSDCWIPAEKQVLCIVIDQLCEETAVAVAILSPVKFKLVLKIHDITRIQIGIRFMKWTRLASTLDKLHQLMQEDSSPRVVGGWSFSAG